MNIKALLKKKIIKEVLMIYKADWSVLIYDKKVGEMMLNLFAKSELNEYSISEAFLINIEKPNWDFPAIYFISGIRENYNYINTEFEEKKFNKYYVIIIDVIDDPRYLNSLIKTKILYCNIKVEEERVFTGNIEKCIQTMEFLLDTKFNIYIMPCLNNIPIHYSKTDKNDCVSDFLILDRSFDLFTPLIHFFTFKSILYEMYPNEAILNDGSQLYKDIRYKHIAEINDILQYNISKLNQNMDKLNKNLSTSELSKMVLEAPENMKLKESIEKYSNYLNDAFTKLEYLQKTLSDDVKFNSLIESELILATGIKDGKKVQIDLSSLFDILASAQLQTPDKIRLLYLIKFRGVNLTVTEQNILKQSGFSANDIDVKLNLENKYQCVTELDYKYEISRFIPYLHSIIRDYSQEDFKSFLIKINNLESDSQQNKTIQSLRKLSMITVKKKESYRKKLVIYILNGITPEECKIVNDLSISLGIDIILGSNNILRPQDVVPMIKTNYKIILNDKE